MTESIQKRVHIPVAYRDALNIFMSHGITNPLDIYRTVLDRIVSETERIHGLGKPSKINKRSDDYMPIMIASLTLSGQTQSSIASMIACIYPNIGNSNSRSTPSSISENFDGLTNPNIQGNHGRSLG